MDEFHEVVIPDTGSQFRSRDAFPSLLPRLLERDPGGPRRHRAADQQG